MGSGGCSSINFHKKNPNDVRPVPADSIVEKFTIKKSIRTSMEIRYDQIIHDSRVNAPQIATFSENLY